MVKRVWEHSILLLFALFPLTGRATCPADSQELSTEVQAAGAAFSAMDLGGFVAARTRAAKDLVCLEQPLTPPDAGAYHRMEALAAFLQRDAEGSVAAFRASLSVQPAYELPTSIAPEGHPLHTLYETARGAPAGEALAILSPEGASVHVDGLRSATRPADLPAVLQLVAYDGSVLWSGYVDARSELPAWPEIELPPAPPIPVVEVVPPRRVSVPLLVSAGAVAAASGGLYAAARTTRARYDDPQTSFEDLDGIRQRTNGLETASQVAGAAALGMGVAAFVVVRR
jgi:hypothetical protein